MPTNVKCVDCGFLAVRHIFTRGLVSPEDGFRQQGTIPTELLPGTAMRPTYETPPICIRGVDIGKEHSEMGGKAEGAVRVINAPRECDKWTALMLGFTPKEHVEMDLADRQRQWHEQQAEAQRTWQAEQAALADARYSGQATLAESRHQESMRVYQENVRIAAAGNKSNVWAILVASAITAAATLTAVVVARMN